MTKILTPKNVSLWLISNLKIQFKNIILYYFWCWKRWWCLFLIIKSNKNSNLKLLNKNAKIHFFFAHFFDLKILGTSVFCEQCHIWGCNIKVYDIFECCFQGFQILTDRFLKLDQGCQIYRLFIILEYARILRMWGITLWAGNLLYESQEECSAPCLK